MKSQHKPLPLLLALSMVLAFLLVTARAEVMYVTNFSNNTIDKIDPITGANLGVFASTGLNGPTGLTFDSVGNLYAANGYSSVIMKFTPSGIGSVFGDYAATGQYASSGGMAFDGGGNLYVALVYANAIIKFTPNGSPSIFASTGLNLPHSLVFDSVGNLYAANYAGNTIEKFSSSGVDLGVFASTGLSNPSGLAFDSSGNLYVSNRTNNTIEKFSPSGTDLGVFASTGLNDPVALGFDSAGNLYATNLGDSAIVKFSSSGTVLGILPSTSTGLNSPNWLAFEPISNEKKVFAVQKALTALLPTVDKGTQKPLQKAIESIANSLDPALWVDGNHLDPKDGQKVFEGEKQAARTLTDVYNNPKTPPQVVTAAGDAIDTLVTTAVDLATTAMADAMTGGGDGKKLAEATKELGRAAAADQAGNAELAIDRAKIAWQKAQEAIKK